MSTVTSKDGTTIAYDKVGEGPPVILVDGALGYRAFNPLTGPLQKLLASSFTAIAYDRRGRGESGDTPPYDVEREIEDLAALIDAAGEPVFLYGISSGSALALDAVAHGLSIKKLAVYEPPFIVDDSRPPLPDDYVEHLDQLVAAERRGDAVEYFMTTAIGMPADFAGQMRESDPSWGNMEQTAHTLSYDGRFVRETMAGKPLPPDRWRGGTVPTLVMDGSDSDQHMHTAAQSLVDILPQADRRTLPDQTHQVDPAALAPVLEEFFKG